MDISTPVSTLPIKRSGLCSDKKNTRMLKKIVFLALMCKIPIILYSLESALPFPNLWVLNTSDCTLHMSCGDVIGVVLTPVSFSGENTGSPFPTGGGGRLVLPECN